MSERCLSTPVGLLTVIETDGALTALEWRQGDTDQTPLLVEAEAQLQAYFASELKDFTLPCWVNGSRLQQQVCAQMQAIPFGDTKTYGDLAKQLNVPAQAIGQACGGNPIPVIIPCHRILAANTLGGFSGAGGVETKVWLLKHEGAASLLI